VARSRAAVDDDIWVAGDNDRSAAMTLAGAGYLVADPGNTLALRISSGRTADYGSTVARGIADHNERSSHRLKQYQNNNCKNNNFIVSKWQLFFCGAQYCI
jgi:hypothetical protein